MSLLETSYAASKLWDLRGKHYGVPIYRLLGGPTRDGIKAYGSTLGHSLEPELASERAPSSACNAALNTPSCASV